MIINIKEFKDLFSQVFGKTPDLVSYMLEDLQDRVSNLEDHSSKINPIIAASIISFDAVKTELSNRGDIDIESIDKIVEEKVLSINGYEIKGLENK